MVDPKEKRNKVDIVNDVRVIVTTKEDEDANHKYD